MRAAIRVDMTISKIFVLLLFAAPVFAMPKPVKSQTGAEVETVLARYRLAKAITAKVKKTVFQETMQSESKSQGDFYFAKGKLRIDISEPEKTTLVYDGKTVWFESRLDDQHVSVTKMRASSVHKSGSLLAALFERKGVLDRFKLVGNKTANGGNVFSYEAKDKKKSDVRFLEIAIKNKDIQRITYRDQIENRVTLEFSNLSKGAVPASKFVYKPPRSAEITEP